MTRSKSKESLHRSKEKSKSKENLSGLPKDSEAIDVILERGERGYGFSLGIQFFLRDFAPDSPAANNAQIEKGDILLAVSMMVLLLFSHNTFFIRNISFS